MSIHLNRRSFVGQMALAGGAAAAMPDIAKAQGKTKTGADLMTVGFACVGSSSHGGLWAPTINPVPGDRWPGRSTNMLITHCWDSRPEEAERFAGRYGCEVVKH